MPGLTRLQEHGMLFEHAFTNACMCSPARSTPMSGYFPAQHGVKYTLETDMPAPQYPQVELSTNFKNLAYKAYRRTLEQEREFKRLKRKLARVEQTRLQPLS
jgi:arylsulfatase A-like enzyme